MEDLPRFVITRDGITVDGDPIPFPVVDEFTVSYSRDGVPLVHLALLAETVTINDSDPVTNTDIQQTARQVFARHNPAAFKETSA